ncbi:MAG: response regulator [Planctomycetes bacterium]|nr:response regulator [Planctomycetota bacterium]
MDKTLNILHLEDNPLDAELTIGVLRSAGFSCRSERVVEREEFLARLQAGGHDVILLDHNLPHFDGITALRMAREHQPGTPAILISGTVGEEVAIECLKAGATDYVMKSRLERLAPVMRRALEERDQLLQRQRAEEALHEYLAYTERLNEELKTSQLELESAVRDLTRINHELDDFAYIASHDLKEPLRGIHNYATFLLEDYQDHLDEEGRAKLETLTRLAQRLEGLIDGLLRFSRVGRMDVGRADADLNEVVHEILDSLQVSLRESAVAVRIPRRLPVVSCDPMLVGEVFHNLVTNAIKYNDKSAKWVEIGYVGPEEQRDESAAPRGSDSPSGSPRPVAFYVRDNGIGIPQKHAGVIFRIFKRLHGRDQFGGGTGAGLTIAKKIVERHGGRIWLDSVLGEGTTFWFTLQGEKGKEGARDVVADLAGAAADTHR